MTQTRELRDRLEATQARLQTLEAGGDDEALLRAAMELNEKRARLAQLQAQREALAQTLTQRLLAFRDFQRGPSMRGFGRDTWLVSAFSFLIGGVLGTTRRLDGVALISLGVLAVSGLGVGAYRWFKTRTAVDEASRLL